MEQTTRYDYRAEVYPRGTDRWSVVIIASNGHGGASVDSESFRSREKARKWAVKRLAYHRAKDAHESLPREVIR